MKKIIYQITRAALAAYIWINSCPALAQDEITVLDTIVVTDSGTKQKLLETNSAITVLTQKDIKNSGQTRTSELISSIPLDNIEKIEVIKSPPASEYGADSARGAILITTRSGLSADVQKDRRANGYWAVSGGTAYYVLPTRSDQEMTNAGIKLDYEKNEYLLHSALIFTQDNEIATEMKDFNHPAVNTRKDDEQDDREDTRVDFKITGGLHFDLGKKNYKDTLKLGLDYKNQDYQASG